MRKHLSNKIVNQCNYAHRIAIGCFWGGGRGGRGRGGGSWREKKNIEGKLVGKGLCVYCGEDTSLYLRWRVCACVLLGGIFSFNVFLFCFFSKGFVPLMGYRCYLSDCWHAKVQVQNSLKSFFFLCVCVFAPFDDSTVVKLRGLSPNFLPFSQLSLSCLRPVGFSHLIKVL